MHYCLCIIIVQLMSLYGLEIFDSLHTDLSINQCFSIILSCAVFTLSWHLKIFNYFHSAVLSNKVCLKCSPWAYEYYAVLQVSYDKCCRTVTWKHEIGCTGLLKHSWAAALGTCELMITLYISAVKWSRIRRQENHCNMRL